MQRDCLKSVTNEVYKKADDLQIRKANRKRSLTRYSSARHGSEQVEDVQHVEKITRLKPLPKGSRKTEEGEEEEVRKSNIRTKGC